MTKELVTERFLLRNFNRSDLENVFLGLSNSDVIKYYGISYSTIEETKLQLDWFSELEEKRTGQWWAICDKGNSDFIGGIGFNNFQSKHYCAELGIWLLPQYWGKGILVEAIDSVFNFAVSEWKLHRMEAVVESENYQCIKGLEKAGFVYEGRRRECECKNGKFIDLNIYSKLAK